MNAAFLAFVRRRFVRAAGVVSILPDPAAARCPVTLTAEQAEHLARHLTALAAEARTARDAKGRPRSGPDAGAAPVIDPAPGSATPPAAGYAGPGPTGRVAEMLRLHRDEQLSARGIARRLGVAVQSVDTALLRWLPRLAPPPPPAKEPAAGG